MATKNNIMIVRHRLLKELVKLWKEESLIEEIDRLPIKLSPKGSKHPGRCCIHKERPLWRFKSLPQRGLVMDARTGVHTPR